MEVYSLEAWEEALLLPSYIAFQLYNKVQL